MEREIEELLNSCIRSEAVFFVPAGDVRNCARTTISCISMEAFIN